MTRNVPLWPSYSFIVSHTHVVLVISLRWVSNGSKHKYTALYHIVTWARWPFARIIIANGVLPRGEVRRGRKSVICRLPRGALKCTKKCNPSNAAYYCVPISGNISMRHCFHGLNTCWNMLDITYVRAKIILCPPTHHGSSLWIPYGLWPILYYAGDDIKSDSNVYTCSAHTKWFMKVFVVYSIV